MSNNDKTELVLPLIYGVGLHGLLYYGIRVYTHFAAAHSVPGSPPAAWYVLSYPLLWAMAATAPGFVAGWFSRNYVFVLGACIGFLASMIEQPFIDMHWDGRALPWRAIAQIAAYALSPAMVSAVACAAGLYARRGRIDPQPAVAAPQPPIARRKK